MPRSDDDDEVQWELGPNLKQEFITNIVPLPDDVGSGVFFLVSQWFLHLSVYCNWRFVDKAFRGVVSAPSRTFHMYSDVCASTMIENKDLRKVQYIRVGGGSVYFKPLQIQCIPIRNDIVETIETEVAESESGELVNFGKGEGILTLHFKKQHERR